MAESQAAPSDHSFYIWQASLGLSLVLDFLSFYTKKSSSSGLSKREFMSAVVEKSKEGLPSQLDLDSVRDLFLPISYLFSVVDYCSDKIHIAIHESNIISVG